MKKQLSKLLASFMMTAFIMYAAQAQTNTTLLDEYILDEMNEHVLPGLAFCIIKDGKVALTKGYGIANIDRDIPYTPNTIMGISSLSKPVTATAIMKLWQQGLFQLDDPVNNYLPFTVTNPFFPNSPITFRMLLTHTASISTGLVLVNGSLKQLMVPPGTAPSLSSYLQSFFSPGGSLYVPSSNYLNFQPGTHYEYSNIAYALLGYLVERISGMPFNQYCNQSIFQPLCMSHTAWYYSELDTNLVARPYRYYNSANHPTDLNLYEFPDYPAFGLKSTATDLSKFMLMHANFGALSGTRILDSITEVMMRTVQGSSPGDVSVDYDGQPFYYHRAECLGFWQVIQYSYENEIQYGHTGFGPGMLIRCYFIPEEDENTIVTVLSNGDNKDEQIFAHLEIFLDLNTEVADTVSDENKPVLNCSYFLYPCVHNDSYWKDQQQEWATNSVPMKIGTKHYYSKNQVLDLLNRPVNGDASIALGKALVAAKFNVAQGSELSPVISTIISAMNVIGDKRLPYNNPVSFSSSTGIQMLSLAATLNSYNSGAMNTGFCPSSGEIQSAVTTSEILSGPNKLSLSVFPNPFPQSTKIYFTIPQKEKVLVTIYDINGRLVKKLAGREFEKGTHNLRWDATRVNAGTYIVRLQTSSTVQTKKLIVLK